MKFPPKSDEELLDLLPEGEYHFVVKEAQDTVSKAGAEMIKLTLEINGKTIFDYLLQAVAFKIKHFAYAVGLDQKYESGEFEASDCRHRDGVCVIARQEGSGGFGPKNTVKDYLKRTSESVIGQQTQPNEFDDTIPF